MLCYQYAGVARVKNFERKGITLQEIRSECNMTWLKKQVFQLEAGPWKAL